MKIIFAGTPEFSAVHLRALLDAGMNVIAVYTQPDRHSGRGKKIRFSDVKQLSIDHQIPVYQPETLRNDTSLNELASLKPDLMVVVAYGLLLPKAVLELPTHGCINVHASLLPRWRGAAPIERAIEVGDTFTGVTIMQMDEGLDTGDMLATIDIPITPTLTGDELRLQLAEAGKLLLLDVINQISSGSVNAMPQDSHSATYAKKLSREEAHIDWSIPAIDIDRKIRAFNSSNVCYSSVDNQQFKIWQARHNSLQHNASPGQILDVNKHSVTVACGNGVIELLELQLANSKKLPVNAILNGKRDLFVKGKYLGQTTT